ncbi:HD-GYP domain-containing protein [Hahella ganghwensis]|uniref:HD-GYP domain-containing protein n=1 Tax=Hahella ganghwensis TaxID=286420 RepID=UPI00035EFE0E|nr:HD-GYP domain-containing protein [Hahella ganghwensis]
MAAESIKVSVSELSIGMFVADLDRPWCQTPFPLQGFYIRSSDDIHALQSYCRHVFIDRPLARSAYDRLESVDSGLQTRLKELLQSGVNARNDESQQRLPHSPIVIRKPIQYDTKVTLKKGIRQARKLVKDIDATLGRILEEVNAGLPVDITVTEKLAHDMTQSVLQNPDALVWLSRVQKKDEHSYSHAVSASIWGLVLGRHLGLSPTVLQTLASGLLLSQVGKAKLSDALLSKNHYLNAEEFKQYKAYVEEGVNILMADPAIPPQVVTIVEYHRERHNGSGFPKGVSGDKIPLLAKVAGLVDYYQEMIEPRPGVEAMKPSEAVARLYQVRNIEFQEDLIERFIDAIGVYPTGTMVELSNHQIGVVVANNPERKLWPTVMVVIDEHERPLKKGKVVNLREYNDKKKRQEDFIQVMRSLPFGAYDINPAEYVLPEVMGRWRARSVLS